jgi:MSHA biogenesis protein MshP
VITKRRRHREQSGFALVAALFLIVVLAGIGIYAIRIGGAQQESANANLLAARADAAALTGLEYATNQAVKHTTCPPTPLPPFGVGGLSGFSITVTCSAVATGVSPYQIYTLQSTATTGTYGSAGYASRKLTRVVTDTP